jgi:hypothetical protein
VEVAGEPVIEGFAFSDTEDLSALAGQALEGVQVKVSGTDDVAIDVGNLDLPASGSYTAVAHLDETGTPTLTVFENDISTLPAGQGRLVVRHAAAAPAVDVLAGGEAVFSGLANGGGSAAALPAGTVSATVVPAATTEPVVIGPADLAVEEGSALVVYAVGSLDDASIDVITETIDGLDGAPSEVPTGNSPVGALPTDGVTTPLPLVELGLVVGLAGVAGLAGLGLRRRA